IWPTSGSRADREACDTACHPALARVPRTPAPLRCRPTRDRPTGATCSTIRDAAEWRLPDGDSPPPRRRGRAATRPPPAPQPPAQPAGPLRHTTIGPDAPQLLARPPSLERVSAGRDPFLDRVDIERLAGIPRRLIRGRHRERLRIHTSKMIRRPCSLGRAHD